jgi:hypothetical protein
MTNFYKKFFVNNLVVSAVLAAIGWAMFSSVLSGYYQPMFPLLIVFALLINLIMFYIVTHKNQSPSRASQIIIKGFAIKFFSYLGITLLFFLIENNFRLRITYIFTLFCIYVVYTILEVISLTKFFKARDINS